MEECVLYTVYITFLGQSNELGSSIGWKCGCEKGNKFMEEFGVETSLENNQIGRLRRVYNIKTDLNEISGC
jgi:hypothetical protein